MTSNLPDKHRRGLSLADWRGLARLGTTATRHLTGTVEQLHHTIASGSRPLGASPPGRPGGITGLVYRLVHGGTQLLGAGLEQGLASLERQLGQTPEPRSAERDALVAALNGLWGDHLAETGNPLAITMRLRRQGQPLSLVPETLAATLPQATGRVVVWLHGLCMHDGQWTRGGHNHAQALGLESGWTSLWLHYNSGLHVADNGARLSALLDEALRAWPVPVTELALVGHSMGGLVARSAVECARQSQADWLARLTRVVCLGTPHQGAVLERGGHLVDQALALSPYLRPFTTLGRARSAGITDLRHGLIKASEWQAQAAQPQAGDPRTPTAWPAHVKLYLVAATTAAQAKGLQHALLGDGLVSVASALGRHDDPALDLHVPASRRLLLTSANHWDLLSRPEVGVQIGHWLASR